MNISNSKVNSLSVYYQNVRGLRTKTHTFFCNLSISKYDIIILTETWLNSNVLSSELFDGNYIVYRRDREESGFHTNKGGGGVLIAVSKLLNSTRQHSLETRCEDLWVTVELGTPNKSCIFAFCALYLPPPVLRTTLEYFLSNLSNVSEQLNCHKCIVGDFNLSSINWEMASQLDSYQTSSMNQDFLDFLNLNNYKQHNFVINSMTRILDLVLSDFPSPCDVSRAVDVLCPVDPLHPPLLINIVFSCEPKLPYNDNNIKLNFHKVDYEAVNTSLGKINWNDLFADEGDVNKLVEIFYVKIRELISKYVPAVIRNNRKYPPWFSSELIKRLNEKNKYRIKYRKFKNPLDLIAYQLLTERCTKLASKCYHDYLIKSENKISSNPKYFWSYVKERRGGSGTYPATLTDGSTESSDGNEVCNMFASHFACVYQSHVSISDSCELDSVPGYGHYDLFASLSISQEDIFKALNSLDITKGAGPDNIPPVFIRNCATNLVYPLFYIFKTSLDTGVFPSDWKISKVVPIHKSGDVHQVNNYRPISILSTFAKIFESLVCPFIQSHFEKYVNDEQHGFLRGRSTHTNLVSYFEDLAESVDKQKQVDAIYTDFSKAFDKVVHKLLLTKLNVYGFSGVFLNWLKSYLSERIFFVVVNGFSSFSRNILSGVPQGSHLGPILFNIFVNDLILCFSHSTPVLFADDLKLYKIIESWEDVLLFQKDLNSLFNWCSNNGMKLNISKCFHIKFTRRNTIIPSVYHINNTTISETEHIKDLGVIFDTKLTFVPQIDTMIKKATKMLGFVMRYSKLFKRTYTKIILYNNLVRSILEYGSVVWRPHFATHMLRIERIQKRFVRHLVYSKDKPKGEYSYKLSIEHYNIKDLNTRRDALDLVFLFKIINCHLNCPRLLSKLHLRIPYHMPRKPIPLFAPPPRRTKLGSNSPIPRMTKLYNRISESTDIDINHMSLAKFRKLVNKM